MNRIAVLATSLSLALGACATSPGYHRDAGYYRDASHERDDRYHGDSRTAYCQDCGTVEGIERYDGDGRTTGVGAVAGAVIGGALGNQVGSGSGRTAATVAGAVAGGFAGNAVEKHNRGAPIHVVFVRMDDGRELTFERGDVAGLRTGDRVIIRDGRIALL